MYISIGSNFVNIAGNIIGVFVLQAGVAGVAYPSLLARTLSALVITWLCFSKTNEVRYRLDWILAWNHDLLRRILSIAVPNGVESGIFQLVKVALSSIVALFGTYQIAANGVAQSIWTVTSMCTTVMGIVFITIIGQCMGAQDIRAAEFYFKKLMGITVKMSVVWNVLTFALTPLFSICTPWSRRRRLSSFTWCSCITPSAPLCSPTPGPWGTASGPQGMCAIPWWLPLPPRGQVHLGLHLRCHHGGRRYGRSGGHVHGLGDSRHLLHLAAKVGEVAGVSSDLDELSIVPSMFFYLHSTYIPQPP